MILEIREHVLNNAIHYGPYTSAGWMRQPPEH
jgi:hypothetical protein